MLNVPKIIFCKLSDILDRISRFVVVLALSVMVMAILLQVFCRYILNSPLSWPEELTIFLMAWVAFIGSAVAVKSSEHIGVDLLIFFLPQKIKDIVLLVIKITMMVFAIFLFKAGLQMAEYGLTMTADALRIPMFWPRLSMPVGGFIMIIHLTYQIIADIETMFKKDVAA